ncbi:MAG: DUF2148 domain-containing protein [Candidatus Margulisiibacteriota bacterium]
MALIREKDFLDSSIARIAEEICLAARTAPKTRGMDLVETAVAGGEDVSRIISEMERIYSETGREGFKRNSESLKDCTHIVLIGVKRKTAGLKPCQLCGFKDCEDNDKHDAACFFNSIDLGIAIGSAVSIAADRRIDNRVMWTIGMAAKNLGIFGKEVKQILGIPLSATGKSVFFDRK